MRIVSRLSSLSTKVLASGFLVAIAIVMIFSSIAQGLTATLPNDSSPPTYLGIGWYPNFDGYGLEVGAYYDTWDPNRTIDVTSSLAEIYDGANCRNPDPDSVFSLSPTFSETEAYVRVRMVVGSTTMTYNINRNNMCRHMTDGVTNTLNLRSDLNGARFVGRYQLPNIPASAAPVDPETGKITVRVLIEFAPRVRVSKVEFYNPNAYFRVVANGGIAAPLGSTASASSTRKVNTRIYSDSVAWYDEVMEFGSPCSLVPGEQARIGIYDPDNYANYPSTVSSTQGGSIPFLYYVEERVEGSSTYAPLPQDAYTAVGTNRVIFSTKSSLNARGYATALPAGITAVEPITETPAGDSSNSLDALVDFTPKVNAKYRLRLVDVHTLNFLQIVVPYDGIYNAINCADLGGEVSQRLEVAPDVSFVETGQQLTGRFFGSSTALRNATINYDAHIWYDKNDNGTYQPSDETIFRETETGGGGVLGPNASDTQLWNHTFTTNITRGSRVCFLWSITPTDPLMTDADPAPEVRCVYIGFKPRASIWGNDLRVGSALNAAANDSTSRVVGNTGMVDGNLRGSWVEYGIFAPGTVSTMASGSRFMADGVATAQSDWSKLTFANTGGVYGGYTTGAALGVIPDVRSYFMNATLPSYITRSMTNNQNIGSYSPNTVFIDSGTVRIVSDINAPAGPVTNGAAGLSQMVIIAAGNIHIASNVQNIDAWLIAPNGRIETCYNAPPQLTTSTCDDKLTITGPVMANQLNLRRTFGGNTDYAETINLRADSYIWARHLSTQTGSWQTKFTTELPPRY